MLLWPHEKRSSSDVTDAKDEERKRSEEVIQSDGVGKITRRHAMKSHNLEHKSAKRKRAFSKEIVVAKVDAAAEEASG